jgi:hypothetical protein
MIVLDEQLGSSRIIAEIERWYRGAVITLPELRPGSRVLDEAVPMLLRKLKEPTFVTINTKDFWKVITASRAYCVVCLRLPSERSLEVPSRLRAVLGLEEFRVKRDRMGCVILAGPDSLDFYCEPK